MKISAICALVVLGSTAPALAQDKQPSPPPAGAILVAPEDEDEMQAMPQWVCIRDFETGALICSLVPDTGGPGGQA